MKRLVNITANKHPFSQEIVPTIKNTLESFGLSVSERFSYDAELTICVGGDGSFLNTLHRHNFPQIPIVGINTGHLGFFQEVHPHEIEDFIESYMKGDYFIQNICPLDAYISTNSNLIKTMGINEIVIKSDKSRTVHLKICVNGNLIESFSGDGIIVSTPSGSTAYNYSAGGSIVDPSINLIQITPLSPINTTAYRSFTSSIILPENAVIDVYPEDKFENSMLIVSDGIEYKYPNIEKISLSTSQTCIKLLRLKDYEFWSKVTEKFL